MVEWFGKWIKFLKDFVWLLVFEFVCVVVVDLFEGLVVFVVWELGLVEDDVFEVDNGVEYDLFIFVVGMGSIVEGGGGWYWCCYIGKYFLRYDV